MLLVRAPECVRAFGFGPVAGVGSVKVSFCVSRGDCPDNADGTKGAHNMKWMQGWLIVMVPILTVAGCGKKEDGGQGASPEAERLKEQASETLKAAQDFTIAKKEDFMKTMQTNLDRLEQKMQDLKAGAQAKGDQAAAEFEKYRAEFDEKASRAKQELSKIKDVGSDAWQGVKDAAQAAYDELEKTYNEIAAKYK